MHILASGGGKREPAIFLLTSSNLRHATACMATVCCPNHPTLSTAFQKPPAKTALNAYSRLWTTPGSCN